MTATDHAPPADYDDGDGDDAPDPPGWGWFGSAFYLASSWTWCIGMFLPVLLVRDYGIWGFVVFAVPNIIGAAAMGWVIRSDETSRRILVDHAIALRWFSAVTIAYHWFFVGWIIRALTGTQGWYAVGAAVLATMLFWLIGRRHDRSDVTTGVLVWLISAALFVAYVMLPRSATSEPVQLVRPFSHQLALIAPVMALGFLLCPYLDPTFHRARASLTPGRARAAFTVGFFFLFAAMILFSLYYALDIEGMTGLVLLWILAVHMSRQTGFTIAAHAHQMARLTDSTLNRWLCRLVILIGIVIGVGFATGRFGYLHGRAVYITFLSLYGTVFPIYVIVMLVRAFRSHGAKLSQRPAMSNS